MDRETPLIGFMSHRLLPVVMYTSLDNFFAIFVEVVQMYLF